MIALASVILILGLIISGLYLMYRMNQEDQPYHVGHKKGHRKSQALAHRRKLP